MIKYFITLLFSALLGGFSMLNNFTNSDSDVSDVDAVTVDLRPTLSIYSSCVNVNGPTPMLLEVRVKELNGVCSTGNIVIRFPRSSFFSFNYDADATNVEGIPVMNQDWTFDDTHPIYWQWKSSQTIPASGLSSFAFLGTFDSRGASGRQDFLIALAYNSGGDTNSCNNWDSQPIVYQ